MTGCSVLKPDAAPDSGFLEGPEKMREGEAISARWSSDYYRQHKSEYKKIYVAPVSTAYLEKTGDWKHIQVSSEVEIKQDAREMADYMEEQFKKAIREGKAEKFSLADRPGPNTITMELAIVELVPTDVARNAAGQVVGFFVPGGGLVSAGAGGSIAMEGRTKDSQSGQMLSMVKDRRVDKIAPIDVAGLTPYRNAKKNIDDWVDGFVDSFNTPVDEKVHINSGVTLSPW